MSANQPAFNNKSDVDFAIIGAGAAGGVVAKELSTAGFRVLVLEQGCPYRNLHPDLETAWWRCVRIVSTLNRERVLAARDLLVRRSTEV